MSAMPAVEVDVPDWVRPGDGSLELYAAIRDEFPFMSEECIWELVRTW